MTDDPIDPGGDDLERDGEDYRVGYKRPPREHQFQPGESGNSRGRRPGAKGLKTILKKELSGRVRITENGATRSISKMELLIKRLVEKGGKGDFKSLAKLLELGALVFGMEDEENSAPKLSREEQAIIDQATERRRAIAAQGKGRPKQKRLKRSPAKPSRTAEG